MSQRGWDERLRKKLKLACMYVNIFAHQKAQIFVVYVYKIVIKSVPIAGNVVLFWEVIELLNYYRYAAFISHGTTISTGQHINLEL